MGYVQPALGRSAFTDMNIVDDEQAGPNWTTEVESHLGNARFCPLGAVYGLGRYTDY